MATRKTSKHLTALVRQAQAGRNKNRKKAEALLREIRARLKRIETDFHAVGVGLRKLAQPQMYSSLGYSSFRGLLEKEQLLPRTTAYRLIAVSEAFGTRDVKRLGAARAYELLAYAEATPAEDLAKELAREDARIGRRKVSSMSVRELREATRKVRAATGRAKERTGDEVEARRAARVLQASLRKQGMKSAKARAVRRGGDWGVSVFVSTSDAVELAE